MVMAPLVLSAKDDESQEEVRAAKAGQIIYKWKQEIENAPADCTVQKVALSGNSYSKVAVVMLSSYLKPFLPNVTAVDLSSIVTDPADSDRIAGLQALCNVFRECKLVEVNLSHNRIGSSEDIVELCDSVLGAQRTTLRHLFLKNMSMTIENMNKVADFLTFRDPKDGFCVGHRLNTVHFHNEEQDDGGAEPFRSILACSRHLVNIRYSGCKAYMVGSNALGAGFDKMGSHIGSLQKLSLAGSTFGTGNGVSLFAKALSRCYKLTHLNLRNCNLDKDDIRLICQSLQQAKGRILEMDVSQHDFGPDGIVPVAQWLRASSSDCLRVFKCEECNLTSLGVKRVVKGLGGLRLSSLEQLHLSRNQCGQIGAEALLQANLPNLKLIDLNHNCFSWEDLKRLDRHFVGKLQTMIGNDNSQDVDAKYHLSDTNDVEEIFSNISQAFELVLEPCGVKMDKCSGDEMKCNGEEMGIVSQRK